MRSVDDRMHRAVKVRRTTIDLSRRAIERLRRTMGLVRRLIVGRRIRRGELVLGGTGAAILAVSVVLTVRATSPVGTGPTVARFPGSLTVIPMGSLLPSAKLPARVSAVVVHDEAAVRYYGSRGRVDSITGAWRDALRAVGADARVVRSTALGSAGSADVVVIPSAPCMAVATRELIERRRTGRGRGGLIVTGIAGTHDAGCREIGYGLLTQLTGASRVVPLDAREMVYVTFPHGGPLTVDIPPGARVELDPGRQIALRRRGRDAYFSGYTLDPLPAGGNALVDGAVVHSTVGAARVVYWGFDLTDASSLPWTQGVLSLLVRNSLAWAADLPMASLEPWPGGARAAALFAQDVEDQFENARHALDSLRDAGVRSTFFLTSDIARRHRGLTRALAEHGEVGTHSENHRLLGGTPEASQRARLDLTRRDLSDITGSPVVGLRPPQEQFDRATMIAWLAVGGTYLFGANNSRVAAPELLAVGGDTLVLLGRVAPDDFIAAAPGASRDPAWLTATFLHEFSKARALGGLFLFSYHSQLFSRPEHVPIVARVARTVAADSAIWVATAGEIAEWWRARSAVLLRVSGVSEREVRMTARNTGRLSARNVVVRVTRGDAAALVRLPTLAPGESHTSVARLVPQRAR